MAKEKAEELEEFQEPAGEKSEQRDEPKAKRRRTDKQVGDLLTTYRIWPCDDIICCCCLQCDVIQHLPPLA